MLVRMVCGGLLTTLVLVGAACTGELRSLEEGVDPLDPEQIRAVAVRVADWQLDHPKGEPTGWTNAVFYTGVMATYRLTGDPKYLARMVEVGEQNDWQMLDRYRHADDHAIAQTYLELFRLEPDPRRYRTFREAIDRMIAEPPNWAKKHQEIDFWWCDALFMSPPALAKLADATGEVKYLDLMDRLWRETHDLLYNRQYRLYHRDTRFRDKSGEVFWARGNGWVLAGLARVLDELAEDRRSRVFYEELFRDLSSRVAELQGEDGLWRSDLLAGSSDPGESSGSALFGFALAWGVRHGLLDPDQFLPVVTAAWNGLYRSVNEEGRLGWVQKPGAKPGKVSARHWEVYGSGAFLLAAEQVLAIRQGS